MSITISTRDVVGTAYCLRGQTYRLIGFEEREEKLPLALLASECSDCGDEFKTKTPLSVKYPSRRCERHASPGRRVERVADERKWQLEQRGSRA